MATPTPTTAATSHPSSSSSRTPTSPTATTPPPPAAAWRASASGSGGNIMVTFCAAQPPQVSYLCVHATAYDTTPCSFAIPPRIVSTEETDGGGVLLLSVVVGNRPSDASLPRKRHYFVYDAGVPSLTHIKHPGDDHTVNKNSLAIVRTPIKPDDHRSSSSYVLAAQSAAFGYGNPASRLCLYHSDTDSWSKVPVNVDSVPYEFRTNKAITIGSGDEGLVAWVDLSHMITFCSVLDNKSPKKKLWFLRLSMSTLHIGLPKMSLEDDCILYFLAKIDYRDRERTAWVLAVDMKNKTVERVTEFSPKRSIALSTGYDSSRISKYLKVAPGKDMNSEMTRDATAC